MHVTGPLQRFQSTHNGHEFHLVVRRLGLGAGLFHLLAGGLVAQNNKKEIEAIKKVTKKSQISIDSIKFQFKRFLY